MNKIDRATVKAQARQLLKGNVLVLFIITLIVSFLTASGAIFSINFDGIQNIFQNQKDNQYENQFGYGDDFDLDNFFENNFGITGEESNPIDDFGSAAPQSNSGSMKIMPNLKSSGIHFSSNIASIISLVCAPLEVTLLGFYVAFVRRKEEGSLNFGFELGHLFKVSFNHTYGKKLAVSLIKNILTVLLALLFIIPGIVFNYSAYFAFQIMCEYPHLSPMEAIRLSKKITKGNRGELFVLNLSFIPWYLLILVTLGIASIYVTPYIYVTDALYYENFRLRALAEGRVSEADFMTPQQRAEDFVSNQNYNYNTVENNNQGSYFYNPPQPQQAPESDSNSYFTEAPSNTPPSYTPTESSYIPTESENNEQ